MTRQEFERLLGYRYAAKNRPVTNRHVSRRFAKKNMGKARGQKFLKRGYISQSVHMETIFKKYPQ